MTRFALQGTNAHAILAHAPGTTSRAAVAASPPWQRRRLWYAPPQHVLLQRAVCHAATVQFAALLSHAHLACMWDHQVMAPHPPIQALANRRILTCTQRVSTQ